MKKAIIAVISCLMTYGAAAKDNDLTSHFIDEVKAAADRGNPLTASIDIDCPAPSASGKLLITKASYEVGKSLGVYVFKNGNRNASLDWLGSEFPDDDFASDTITGMNFGLTMPGGQFFITVMKSGLVKAGVNANGTSGIKEVECKAIKPE